MEEKSVFQTLNEIDVSPFLKEKNGMKYLPWSSAWTEVKKKYAQATYKVHKTSEGTNYFTDGKT